MRVMTFNLRFENDRDGENNWLHRRELVVDVVRRQSPDILGTQEGTMRQLNYLQNQLSGYRMHAPCRCWDETCQYPTLFYRAERFRMKDGGEFWLSLTPGVHRSKDWDSAFPRMMSYGLAEDLREGKSLWVAVTHLDHRGAEARKCQVAMIVDWMRDKTEPRLLMGDFNDLPGSPVHRLLTSAEADLLDTWQALARPEDEESMTHHDFKGIPEKCRMDWIFVSRHFRAVDAHILRDHREGRYPSDHFPYAVELAWA